MSSLLRKALDIRQGEGERTLIMFSYIFLIIASYYILKPMTRSLFLKNLGPAQLPLVYMLVALVVGFVAVLYAKISANVRFHKLIIGTTLVLMSNLLIFWWLLDIDSKSTWLYYSLYIWTSIYGVLTTTQFWLLAHYIFNPREAKRLFPLLAAGAILGGIIGGYFTRALVKEIGGTSNLALFCFGFLGMTILLMNLAWRRRDVHYESIRRRTTPTDEGQIFPVLGEIFMLIRNSRHLAILMGIVAMTVMVSQIADFQFSTYASDEIVGMDDLTEFLGFWLSNLSVISLIFQILFAGVIIRRFGVGVSVLFLPLAMLVTSTWVFLGYGLASILALKMGDGAFRHSINKAGLELLYLPIPSEIKKKTKAFVDMFADRLARGFSGLLLLIFYTWLGLSVAQISLISGLLIGIWLILALMTRREYVNSFRQALAKRRIDAELLTMSIKDERTINTLVTALASRNERQVVYALQLLESVEGVNLTAALQPLLHHSCAEVRLRTLRLLLHSEDSNLLTEVKPLLRDSDEQVRREAVRFFSRFSKDSTTEMLGQWLQDEHSGLRGAALYCVAEQPAMAAELLCPSLIQSFLESGSEARAQVADALGILGNSAYHSILLKLLDDPDPWVRTRAMVSSGKTRSDEFVSVLIRHLKEHTDRRAARQSLSAYGDAIVGILCEYLNDEKTPIEVRREIPRVLGLIGTQHTVDVLLDSLLQIDEILRYQIIKALNKLRNRNPKLQFDQRVDRALIQELRKYYQILSTLHWANSDEEHSGRCSSLLKRALCERLDDHLERIFRLLGLRYPPHDIYNAYAATTSSNRTIRASAVEYLDNILSKNLKRILLPVVEDRQVDQILQCADGLLDVPLRNRKEALENLVSDRDPWLRACALYEIGVGGLTDDLKPLLKQAKRDPDTIVQETAAMVLQHYS